MIFGHLIQENNSHLVISGSGELLEKKGHRPLILDDSMEVLTYHYSGQWNKQILELSQFPPLLIRAVIESEDRNFHHHVGLDFKAKIRAIFKNLQRLSFNQGGSTISEQVIRIIDYASLKPKKGIWRKILHAWGALILETRFSKEEILRFYFNQVPFASHRRGFEQAGLYYFDRSLETLNQEEILALSILLQAPSLYHKQNFREILLEKVRALAKHLNVSLPLDLSFEFLKSEETDVDATLFSEFVMSHYKGTDAVISSTLNRPMQTMANSLLKENLVRLKNRGALHGSVMVVDHQTGHIKVMAGINGSDNGYGLNPALIKRQVGSTFKPFLYSYALENGFSTGDILMDAPTSSIMSGGLHPIKNYSEQFYSEVTIRQALANSLNTPAIRMIREIGVDSFYQYLLRLGLSFDFSPDIYGEGLALGNAQVSLYDMMKIYTCLANRGECQQLIFSLSQKQSNAIGVISKPVADMVLDILSDPLARSMEFGFIGFNHQVAFKTGTTTDYRDAWAFIINSQYLVGVWIGRLDARPMDKVTGATGALSIAKSFIEAKQLSENATAFALSPHLIRADGELSLFTRIKKQDESIKNSPVVSKGNDLLIIPDAKILHVAIDPRIPMKQQVLLFKNSQPHQVDWFDNQAFLKRSYELQWPLKEGIHEIMASNGYHQKTIKVIVSSDSI